MASETTTISPPVPGRVTSVDFFRGLTMFLLAGEASELFSILLDSDNVLIHFLGNQLHHHEWHGLHFWDLIQPFFMFIVGVAIPFAVANRLKKGESINMITRHYVNQMGAVQYIVLPMKKVFRWSEIHAGSFEK